MKWNERCSNCGEPKMFLRQAKKYVHANTLDAKCAGKNKTYCQ